MSQLAHPTELAKRFLGVHESSTNGFLVTGFEGLTFIPGQGQIRQRMMDCEPFHALGMKAESIIGFEDREIAGTGGLLKNPGEQEEGR